MKKLDLDLVTPIYVQAETPEAPGTQAVSEAQPVDENGKPATVAYPRPDDTAAYVLGSNGLYLCRNHPLFSSCVPSPSWPRELGRFGPSFDLKFPKIDKARFELIVGFFALVAEQHGAEAAVLILYDSKQKQLRYIVPRQTATVSKGWLGNRYPVDLKYDMPELHEPHLSLVGDIHSHANQAAYASYTDKADESHQAGVHIVVGRVFEEPPEIHCEFVVDGHRFPVPPGKVLQGYERRRDNVPAAWFERLEVEVQEYKTNWYDNTYAGNQQHGVGPKGGYDDKGRH